MFNQCPFKDDRCDIWLDYIIMEDELSQCNELLHSNWISINTLLSGRLRLPREVRKNCLPRGVNSPYRGEKKLITAFADMLSIP